MQFLMHEVELASTLRAHFAAIAPEHRPILLGVADDTYLCGPATAIAKPWEALEISLMAAGHTICRRKCKWWCPGLSDDEAATQHAVLAKAIPQSHGGLLLLGAGAQGEEESLIVCDGFTLDPS